MAVHPPEPLEGRERPVSARESHREALERDGMSAAFGAIVGIAVGLGLWLAVIVIAILIGHVA